MPIKLATRSDLDAIFNITQRTIRAVYPRYYPAGAVDFFCAHHSRDSIREDIVSGMVWIL